jgi:hypothetical protein
MICYPCWFLYYIFKVKNDSFDKNPQRKDRTNSGGGLLIYSKEDIGICRKHELENDIDETIWVEVHAKGHSSNESSSISLFSMLLSRCVSVKTIISNSSTKF